MPWRELIYKNTSCYAKLEKEIGVFDGKPVNTIDSRQSIIFL